jgi:hypothetical protein
MEPLHDKSEGQMYHMNPLSIKTQDLLYGSMWKFLAKILGVVHTNRDAVNAITSEMAHTLG